MKKYELFFIQFFFISISIHAKIQNEELEIEKFIIEKNFIPVKKEPSSCEQITSQLTNTTLNLNQALSLALSCNQFARAKLSSLEQEQGSRHNRLSA